MAPDSASVLAVGDHRRLAERMHRLQFRRREHGRGVALVALHLIGHAELLQQPQDALRARIVEMMDGDHGVPSGCLLETDSNSERSSVRPVALLVLER